MISLSVRNTVADYATFRSVFDAHEPFRRANGATGAVLVYQTWIIPTWSRPYLSGIA
jgi:hypothetical protein